MHRQQPVYKYTVYSIWLFEYRIIQVRSCVGISIVCKIIEPFAKSGVNHIIVNHIKTWDMSMAHGVIFIRIFWWSLFSFNLGYVEEDMILNEREFIFQFYRPFSCDLIIVKLKMKSSRRKEQRTAVFFRSIDSVESWSFRSNNGNRADIIGSKQIRHISSFFFVFDAPFFSLHSG